MDIKSRSKRIVATGAAALGLTLGVAALAGAATSPDQSSTTQQQRGDDQGADPAVNGSVKAPKDEAGSEGDEAKALEGLAKISAKDAEQAAAAAVPNGTVNASELDDEGGSVVYEVDVTDAKGAEVEVIVDAGNGKVLAQEHDDDTDADDCNDAEDNNEADEGREANETNQGNEAPEGNEANQGSDSTPNG